MGHRWIAGLANYHFHIHYKSEKSNVEADALSRIDWEKCDETMQADSMQAIVAADITGNVAYHVVSKQLIHFSHPSPTHQQSVKPSLDHQDRVV